MVVCRVDDPSGRTNTSSFTIAVVDRTPPVINCSTNMTVQATNANGARVTYLITAVDARDPIINVVCNPPSGSSFQIGQTNVNCIATDDSTSLSSCSFQVTVSPPPLVFQNPVITTGTFRLSFVAVTGLNHVVEYRTNLSTGTWTVLTNVPGNGSVVNVVDVIQANRPSRFYRVRR